MAGLEAHFHEQYDTRHFALLLRPCTVAGHAYPNTFYFAAGQNALDYGAAKWRSFSWAPQVGLLRLEALDGEAFELVRDRMPGYRESGRYPAPADGRGARYPVGAFAGIFGITGQYVIVRIWPSSTVVQGERPC